ncbi:glycosyltransferase [Pseudonocardia spinosispora]|uniref:glycosyltransferase n=1 Tax=Pseudonocardia spinosispora TaxID=103441 RepID=UPI00040C165F|nr:glycosyltransferase [Pseudonocardia spinosispora]
MIDTIGVVIPAHNEEDRIGACLTSVRRSLVGLPSRIDTVVAVVLDRCTDRTPEVVRELIRGWPGARTYPMSHRAEDHGVGFVRNAGVRSLLCGLPGTDPRRVWLLNTDADTTVPAAWARDHLRYAEAGMHGVAGLADLADDAEIDAGALARYRGLVSDGMRGRTHTHVYAANLGVRADAYLGSGGFPVSGHGEDHRLWRAMTDAGLRLCQPIEPCVVTSARSSGRAPDGLADLLRSLGQDSVQRQDSEFAV